MLSQERKVKRLEQLKGNCYFWRKTREKKTGEFIETSKLLNIIVWYGFISSMSLFPKAFDLLFDVAHAFYLLNLPIDRFHMMHDGHISIQNNEMAGQKPCTRIIPTCEK